MSAAAGEESAAYDDGAAWASGPQLVYDRLARAALALLAELPDRARALDVGAGTGAATLELLRRGCQVLAVDRSTSMLAELSRQTDGRVPTAVTDICHLGVRDASFDVTVASFVVNHLDRPAEGVGELTRVTRRGGQVVATTFGADDHPIKAAVDEVLSRHGYAHPPWYMSFKRDRIPLTATPEAFEAVGVAAGLAGATVTEVDVDLSDLPLEAAVGYRLGMAHIVPFLTALEPARRHAVRDEVADAVTALPPLRLPMLVLRGCSV